MRLTAPIRSGTPITLAVNLARDTRITRSGDTRITRAGDTRVVRYRALSYHLTAPLTDRVLTASKKAGTMVSVARQEKRITRGGDIRITRSGDERIVRVRVFSAYLTATK